MGEITLAEASKSSDRLAVLPWERLARQTVPCPRNDLLALFRVCQRMEYLCLSQDGIGLSAVQVGLPWKMFVVRETDGIFRYLLDCTYEPVGEEKARGIEGCLSLKDEKGSTRFFAVDRFKEITVHGDVLDAEESLKIVPYAARLKGLYGVVFQHEIDHQNGVLISEIGPEMHLWRQST